MPRRLGVLVAIAVLAASVRPAIALTVPVNAPAAHPLITLNDALAQFAAEMAQVVGWLEASFDGVSHTAQIAPPRALSNVASAAALTEPLAPASPESSAPQSGSVSPPNATTVQSRTITTAPVYLTNVIEEPAQTSGIVTRLNALIAVVGNVLALLPSIENQQPQSEAASVQSQIDALSHEIAQTNQINNLSNVTLSSPSFTSSSGGTGLSTSQVSEGSNLYFTNARVASYINSSSTIPSAAGGSWGNVLAWNGSNWASLATSSLGLGSGGSPIWGSITGTLANQTDLQNALNGKLGSSTISLLSANYDPLWNGNAFVSGAV